MGVQNWLTKLKFKTNVPLQNNYTPLTIQVEELLPKDNLCNLQLGTTPKPGAIRGNHLLRFTLPHKYKEKYITQCRRQPCSSNSYARAHWVHALSNKREHPKQTILKDQQVKKGVLEGSIPSSAWYTAFTSHAVMVGVPFIQTEQRSKRIFFWQMDTPPQQPT